MVLPSIFFLCYGFYGGAMRIAIDKNSIGAVKDGNEYIYVFDNEPFNDLISTNMHCVYYRNCPYVDINLTDYPIDCIKKAKVTDIDYDKLPPYQEFKIGIIVPNYNYEHTLEKCLKSILNQTYKNYQIIFVDDVSTDNSVSIAKELLKPPHKVVELRQKRLNGGARNEGYLHLDDKVDYIYYIDSDDWLYDDTALEKINRKLQTRPDVLFVGMAQFKNNKTTPCFIPQYKDKYEAIAGWSGSCGKVIKKSLATRQECLYNEGTLKEDKNQHCKICIYMNSFSCLTDLIYVWNRENHKSVTTIREKIKWGTSTIRHYADTKELMLSVKGRDSKIDAFLENRLKLCEQELRQGGDRQF